MTNEPKKATGISQPAISDSKFPSAYFLSLEVERVLCFKDRQVLDLADGNGNPAQWTVILGNNGVGKTTLLKCLASLENRGWEGNSMPFLMDPPGSLFRSLSRSSLIWEELQILHTSLAKIATRLIVNAPLSVFKTSAEITKSPKPQRAKIKISLGNPTDCFARFDNMTEVLADEEYKTSINNSEHEEAKEVMSMQARHDYFILLKLLRSIQC